MSSSKVSLKLLIDTKANKVVVAEGNKEFVDLLFHLMSLPVATVVKLLGEQHMVGSLRLLYKSIGCLNTNYLQANVNSNAILNPQPAVSIPLLSLKSNIAPRNFYRCPSNNGYYYDCSINCCKYVADDPTITCPSCSKTMSTKMTYLTPKLNSESRKRSYIDGYVKEVATYMVMDNLEVKPMSTISGITLLNQFQVKDIASLVEKEVPVTRQQGKLTRHVACGAYNQEKKFITEVTTLELEIDSLKLVLQQSSLRIDIVMIEK